jgi:AcrR family transcriptional regulator
MPTPTRKRLPRAEREERMLDAAAHAFAEHGFQAASMEQIAEGSGITKALLYQYFGSKEALYAACVERGRAELFDEIGQALAEVPPGPARLRVFVERYFDSLEANRGSWWLLYGETSTPAVNAMRERNAEAIGRAVRGVLEAADREPDPARVELLAHALVGAGEQVGRWWAEHGDVPKAEVVEHFLVVAGGAIDAVFRQGAAGGGPRRRQR